MNKTKVQHKENRMQEIQFWHALLSLIVAKFEKNTFLECAKIESLVRIKIFDLFDKFKWENLKECLRKFVILTRHRIQGFFT